MSASQPCMRRTPSQTLGHAPKLKKNWKSRMRCSGKSIQLKCSVSPRTSTPCSAAARTFSRMVEYAWREKSVWV